MDKKRLYPVSEMEVRIKEKDRENIHNSKILEQLRRDHAIKIKKTT